MSARPLPAPGNPRIAMTDTFASESSSSGGYGKPEQSGEVTNTLAELERRLRELERELSAIGSGGRDRGDRAQTAGAGAGRVVDEAIERPAARPAAAESSLEQEHRGPSDAQLASLAELRRFRDRLERFAKELATEYDALLGRVMAGLTSTAGRRAPAPAEVRPQAQTPAAPGSAAAGGATLTAQTAAATPPGAPFSAQTPPPAGTSFSGQPSSFSPQPSPAPTPAGHAQPPPAPANPAQPPPAPVNPAQPPPAPANPAQPPRAPASPGAAFSAQAPAVSQPTGAAFPAHASPTPVHQAASAPAPPQAAHTASAPVEDAQAAAAAAREGALFEGRVELGVGPFYDIGSLGAFERRLASLPGVSEAAVRRFEASHAVVDVRLAVPVALVRELRRALDSDFSVREVASGRILLTFDEA